MLRIVISDTSTLILFHNIGELELLQKVYTELVTTPEIALEYGEPLPEWIKLHEVKDKNIRHFLKFKLTKAKQVLLL